MSQSPVEILRSSLRWMSVAALFAVAPKCIVCLAAYVGVGVTLGVQLAGPEICGASAGLVEEPIAWLSLAGAAVGIFVFSRIDSEGFPTKHTNHTKPVASDGIGARRKLTFQWSASNNQVHCLIGFFRALSCVSWATPIECLRLSRGRSGRSRNGRK